MTRNEQKRKKMRYTVALATGVATVAVAAILASGAKGAYTVRGWQPMPELTYEEARAVLLERMPKMEETVLTHYCICRKCCGKNPDHPAYGITASGRKAEPYTSVAVDPKIIPLGSTVYIDHEDGDIRVYRADDTGSAIKGAHIDLCVTEHEEARQMGVDTVTVWWEV